MKQLVSCIMYCVSSLGTKHKIQCTILLLATCYLLPITCNAQKQILRGESNKFMSLDIKKAGTVKRIKFYENDYITLKVKSYKKKFRGTITSLTDTSLVVDSMTIMYKDITKVVVDNNNSLTKVARAFLMIAGGGYIGLDIINNLINSNVPTINPRTVIIGAALIVSGQLVKWLSIKHYKIDNKHRIKYIDDTP